MNIGYDAKRAYHNTTGLGNYSRLLMDSLAHFYPDNRYFLFVARTSDLFKPLAENIAEVMPASAVDRIFASYWRSVRIKKQIRDFGIDLYHGLSNELPLKIHQLNIKTVVTMHDLIYERYPGQYNRIDVSTYRAKAIYACKYAGRIIAASEQTKKDIISYYKIREDKIDVCYQACNVQFSATVPDDEKESVRKKYGLPERFFLSVGSVIERKNLLAACEALKILGNEIDIPLVVIGNGRSYKKKVEEYILGNRMEKKVIFLSDRLIPGQRDFRDGRDLPAIYQAATALLYPSLFEGFGIPVLEAMCSGLPVITSSVSCLPEVGGDAAYYIDPHSPQEIAKAMESIGMDSDLAQAMRIKGWKQAQNFTPRQCAASVMNTYNKL